MSVPEGTPLGTPLVTIEYRTRPGGPRRIERFIRRRDGDYTGAVEGEIVNVWDATRANSSEAGSPNQGD